ncbi:MULTISPECIES: MFS transporter [Dermabacter]|uniref:MFS transporter n=1 Tax=Dermabacter TaxID=36739 RepID=UPI0021A4432F|nr:MULTISPECIES: MFS transporter [Dermabacter]MCT1955728.1 MFS transporter [Dermabacter hominis]MDU1463979.1 MFS transporter [Dermabacter sp.]MDU4692457.1 MFS transporter [Dermabacter sp.]
MPETFLPDREAVRARWAVSLVFLLNGVSFCAILPRYPEIVRQLGINNAELGLAVGLGPLGGLAFGLLAAPIMKRLGSGKTAVIFQILASSAHVLIYLAPSWGMLALGFVLAMSFDAITDIAQNAHGMRVERRYRRSIINSFHGFWSLGAVLGGVIGSTCAQFGVPLAWQGWGGLVVFGAIAIANFPFLLKGSDASERVKEVSSPSASSANDAPADLMGETSGDTLLESTAPQRGKLGALALLGALGMVLVFAGSTEDAGSTWGALFMTHTFDASPFVAGLAFVALQGAQMVGRFVGDPIVDAWGDRKTARVGAVISFVGMGFMLVWPNAVTAVVGFAAAGWGVATLFPAVFRAGDNLEDFGHGVGITVVGWFARIGFLLAPPIVGWLADLFTLRYALALVPLYAIGIFIFAGALEDLTKADKRVKAAGAA